MVAHFKNTLCIALVPIFLQNSRQARILKEIQAMNKIVFV